mmetsp:Transcript_94467/g.270908  ORF Transcript_94467/g.270908 Transcript_94467/m.270908 type:complete len:216 (+) Transcript_94467:205-852(+)
MRGRRRIQARPWLERRWRRHLAEPGRNSVRPCGTEPGAARPKKGSRRGRGSPRRCAAAPPRPPLPNRRRSRGSREGGRRHEALPAWWSTTQVRALGEQRPRGRSSPRAPGRRSPAAAGGRASARPCRPKRCPRRARRCPRGPRPRPLRQPRLPKPPRLLLSRHQTSALRAARSAHNPLGRRWPPDGCRQKPRASARRPNPRRSKPNLGSTAAGRR